MLLIGMMGNSELMEFYTPTDPVLLDMRDNVPEMLLE